MKSLNKWRKNPDSSIENPETEVTLRDGDNNHWNTSTKINQTHHSKQHVGVKPRDKQWWARTGVMIVIWGSSVHLNIQQRGIRPESDRSGVYLCKCRLGRDEPDILLKGVECDSVTNAAVLSFDRFSSTLRDSCALRSPTLPSTWASLGSSTTRVCFLFMCFPIFKSAVRSLKEIWIWWAKL